MKTKKLHFKVCGEGLTDLIRQIYLYEDKEKAWNIIGTLNGITIEQAKSILLGDAKLISIKDGTELQIVEEVDKKWKEEYNAKLQSLIIEEENTRNVNDAINEFMSTYPRLSREEAKYYVIEGISQSRKSTREVQVLAKEAMIRANVATSTMFRDKEEVAEEVVEEELEKEEGFPIANYQDEELKQKQANLDIAKNIFIANSLEKDPKKKKMNDELLQSFVGKEYSFTYKNHEYTFKDSARNQRECPHCEFKAPDGSFWNERDSAYIGYYDGFKDGNVAVCFECPECFDRFYYHYNKNIFKRRVKK